MTTTWHKGIVSWFYSDTLYLSVVFTWDLPSARSLALAYAGTHHIVAGGPAVMLWPDYLSDVAEIRLEAPSGINVLGKHNPEAVFTTRGCPNRCSFCAVPRLEPIYRELSDSEWEPKRVICDNNLLAASKAHFDRVIDRLKAANIRGVDFNQGLDARLLTDHHVGRLAELKEPRIRFAFDHTDQQSAVTDAVQRVRKAGISKGNISVYILFGYEDSIEDAIYRAEVVRGLGINPYPMRYQPLYALKKNEHVSERWTEFDLINFRICYSNARFGLGNVSYSEFIESPRYAAWRRGKKEEERVGLFDAA